MSDAVQFIRSGNGLLLNDVRALSDARFRRGAKLGEALCARSIKPCDGQLFPNPVKEGRPIYTSNCRRSSPETLLSA
jgi:hypothetical protein